jgi:aspartate/tyrosine/aromatic aminotransferase
MKTILQSQDNVIVVSGHDHNLQYIDNDNIKQIISGAGSKSEAARAINSNDFSYGKCYATLDTYENGKTIVSFYGRDNNQTNYYSEKQYFIPKRN